MSAKKHLKLSKQATSRPSVALEVRVLRQFRLVFAAVRKHYKSVERQTGVGGAPVWALSVIATQPGIRVTQLAQAMDVHQSTASNLVKGLVVARLVVSRKSKSDRRAVELYAEEGGRSLLGTVPGPFAGVLPMALAQLDLKTLRDLEGNLELLLRGLDVDERAAQTPIALM